VILVAVPFVKVKSLEYMDWSLDSLNEDWEIQDLKFFENNDTIFN